jgi:hypothetical protein
VEGAANSKHVAKNAELKSLVKSHAWKIAELEVVCADLKHEKEGVMVGYHRMKKMFVEKMERERTELIEAHTMELARVQGELDQETWNYTNYRLNVRRRLHHLHEIVSMKLGHGACPSWARVRRWRTLLTGSLGK